ncbi:MAG: aldehyde dehydrogenase family protein [Campylobacter sp.]|nr:aldehyde dehydrogenase family protein [Campylobacter sp.]
MREFYNSKATKDINFRINALKNLQTALIKYEDEIYKALEKDLHKHKFETYLSELGLVLSELNFTIKHLKSWSKTKRVKTPLSLFSANSYLKNEPYGIVLIISPWNYPINLTFIPLISAIAAGNCIVLKTSNKTKFTSEVIAKILGEIYPSNFVQTTTRYDIADLKFDYIFFTGSKDVGQTISCKASLNLTPCTLELGGKSPCFVDKSADIKLSAKRILFGKLLNAGQTCVAPDYLLVHSSIKKSLISEFIDLLTHFNTDNFPHLIDEIELKRVQNLIDKNRVILGGKSKALMLEPTILDDIKFDDDIMKEEIFAPILPIIEYDDLNQALTKVKSLPTPLALYIFAKDKTYINTVLNEISSGSACINDTLMQISSHYMPFGGSGESGYGRYHGKAGFDTFSQTRPYLNRHTYIDLPIRYHPYTKLKFKLLKLFLR